MWLQTPALQLSGLSPLDELKDIHLPTAVSWWPPAPGWWIVTIVVTFACVITCIKIHRYLTSPVRAASRELTRIRRDFRTHRDVHALATALSIFLRRCGLAAYPRVDVAGLSGRAWLEFLDRTGATLAFTDGPGEALVSAPYQASVDIEAETLLTTVEAWTHAALSADKSVG